MNKRARHKERIVFRNRNKLIITTMRIRTKRRRYNLPDILDHGIMVRQPARALPVLCILLGILIFAFSGESGMLYYGTSTDWKSTIQLFGVLLSAAGILLLVIFRRKYDVVISTPGGISKIASYFKKYKAVNVEMALHEAILYMPRDLFQKSQLNRAHGSSRNGKAHSKPTGISNKVSHG